MPVRFGLIGHGVAGSMFARVLSGHGAEVLSYDLLLDRADTAEKKRREIAADGARPGTLEQTIGDSEYLLAVTPTQACHEAALKAAQYLRPQQVYCDLASTSPPVKRGISLVVEGTGARFVEGAILGAVGRSLVCPAILLGGPAAQSAADVLNHYGLRTRFYSLEVGRASAFKMIRSIFSKGMETLLIEALVAARKADVLDEIWDEILGTLAPDRMQTTLETWIRSHAVSSERRYWEMLEVSRFVEELKFEPVLTRAAADVFRRSNELEIASAFQDEPERFTEVIDFLAAAVARKPETDFASG